MKTDFVQLQTIRLAQSTPLEQSTWTSCKKGKARYSPSERYWTELRGDVILLYPASEIILQFKAHLSRCRPGIQMNGLQGVLERKQESMEPKAYASYVHSFSKRVPKAKVIPVLFRISETEVRIEARTITFSAYNQSGLFPPKPLNLSFDSDEVMEAWRLAIERVPELYEKTLSDFSLMRHIGHGATSDVFMMRDRFSHERIAMKAIEKKGMFPYPDSVRRVIDERLVHSRMRKHPYILQMSHAFETPERLYVATEYCSRGDLFHYMGRNNGRLSEETAKMVAAEVLLAMEALHDQGIWYRDLKPENVMVADNGHVKLGDFGAAKIINPKQSIPRSESTVGTIEYLAPEMASEKPYNRTVDLWAFGIFVSELLNGKTPFEGDTQKQTYARIKKSPLILPMEMPMGARDLVRKLLQRDPSKRFGSGVRGWQDVKSHPWFEGIDWDMLMLRPTVAGPFSFPQEFRTEDENELNWIDSAQKNKRIALGKLAKDLRRDYDYTTAVRYRFECGLDSASLPRHPLVSKRNHKRVIGAYCCGDRRKSTSPLSLEPHEPLSIPDTKNGSISYVTWSPSAGAQWQSNSQSPDFEGSPDTGLWRKLSSSLKILQMR